MEVGDMKDILETDFQKKRCILTATLSTCEYASSLKNTIKKSAKSLQL